ncbi:hypothetical protein H632_c4960p0, partial [Helicosporidium sp. ATCC 50920]
LRESVVFAEADAVQSQDCPYYDRLSLPSATTAEGASASAALARVLKTMLNRLTEPGCAEQLRARLSGPGPDAHPPLDLQMDDVFQLPSEQGIAEVATSLEEDVWQLETLPPAPASPVPPSEFEPAWI